MTYLLNRLKESRGFIAKRAFRKAMLVATIVYGVIAIKDRRIITPELFYEP